MRAARAGILPAFDTTMLSDSVKRFLESEGCSILLGESRREYVARKMSDGRKYAETPDTFLRVTEEAAVLAGDLLVAVDQEICGICRLHDLIPAFPGFHSIAVDPAIGPDAIVTENADSFKPGFIPFQDAIRNGVESIMVGPSIVKAFDSEKPASVSPILNDILRIEFGFKGVVMSDDLDSRATMRDRAIEQVAIDALSAGSDYLLVAAIDS